MIFNKNNFSILSPSIMGICNITKDSFSDGGINYKKNDALNNIKLMIKHGANIIDIGANFGYHSLLFSKYVKNKVFSFEPQEQNYNLLSFNINFNNIKNICSYKSLI